MPEHLHYEEDDAIVNADTQHEESDVNVRALMIFLICFIVFSVFTHFLILFMYKGFVHMERKSSAGNPAVTAMAKPADAGIPATPRLQPFPSRAHAGEVVAPYRNTPVADMTEMRRSQDEHLATYGWVDAKQGTVRIPVEVARQLALQRGAFHVISTPAVPADQTSPAASAPAPAIVASPAPVPPPAVPMATEGSHP